MLDSFLLPEGTDMSELPQLSKLGVKLGLPVAYEGASDLEAFENWLGQLIDWFQAYTLDLDTPAMDQAWLKILSQALARKALSWFRRCKQEAHESGMSLSFHEPILALRDCYLYKATKMLVVTNFESLTQGSCNVQTLLDELQRYASMMSESPMSFQFWRHFLKAMHPNIASWVISMGINAESLKLDDILAAAVDHEESQLYLKTFVSQRHGDTSVKVHQSSEQAKGTCCVMCLCLGGVLMLPVRAISHSRQGRIQSLLTRILSTVVGTHRQGRIQRESSGEPSLPPYTLYVKNAKWDDIIMM